MLAIPSLKDCSWTRRARTLILTEVQTKTTHLRVKQSVIVLQIILEVAPLRAQNHTEELILINEAPLHGSAFAGGANSPATITEHSAFINQPRPDSHAIKSIVRYGDRVDPHSETLRMNAELAHAVDGTVGYRQVYAEHGVYPVLGRRKSTLQSAHICATYLEA